jgi:lipoate-protein ligase A
LPASPLFDVERFRSEPGRLAVARTVEQPTLVLGSTQRVDLVARLRVRERDVSVVRRRGGGGSVYLQPGDHVWIDAWIPRDDPLWVPDVAVAAAWAGAWWCSALAALGLSGFEVHTGRALPGELGELVCFAGRGPGEVFHRGRKVMGLSQWRSREGALFSTCAYAHWDPVPLTELLHLDEPIRAGLARDLAPIAVGVGDLGLVGPDLAEVRDVLLSSFPSWAGGGDVHGT